MSEERIQNITSPQPEEQEIDLIELAQKVWASRKLVFKACGIAALVGLVVAFSIPKEYSTSVTLAPESGGQIWVAEVVGRPCSHGGYQVWVTSSGEDALSPELYPDIVSSTPFLIELFDVKVKDQKAKVDTTLYAYLKEEQRSPWWSAIFSAPFKVLGWTIIWTLCSTLLPYFFGLIQALILNHKSVKIKKGISVNFNSSVGDSSNGKFTRI